MFVESFECQLPQVRQKNGGLVGNQRKSWRKKGFAVVVSQLIWRKMFVKKMLRKLLTWLSIGSKIDVEKSTWPLEETRKHSNGVRSPKAVAISRKSRIFAGRRNSGVNKALFFTLHVVKDNLKAVSHLIFVLRYYRPLENEVLAPFSTLGVHRWNLCLFSWKSLV